MSWLCSLAFVPGCWSLIVDPHVTKDVSPSAPSSATASGATQSARSAVATATGSEERGIWSAGRIRERAGDAGGRARARKRLLRARGDVRGEVRERGRGNSSPAFGGSPTERIRPPVIRSADELEIEQPGRTRPPAAPLSSNSGPETRPRRALRDVRHSARRERGGRERSHEMQSLLSPSLMLRSASVALCRGVGCVLSRSRPSPSPPRAPRPRA